MRRHSISLGCVVAIVAMFVTVAQARDATLGTVHFPTSGSLQAQAHFLRGVAALHSFWYPVALQEFRAATKVEPDFMMGYWGEAMAHNHPLWGDPQNTEAARQVLQNIHDTSQLTARERAYVHAVKVLYGEGDRLARDQAYAAAMEEIYQAYPDDLEAAAFYALALMGSVRPNDPTALRTRMQAAAIAFEVYRQAPNHPGAAHYIIHACDDPDHAILALPAARRYTNIAPAAPHALHMPSHIFLQLGMWPEAVASNKAAWEASKRWVQQNDLPISQRDYHSQHWLLYSQLQQGRYQEAEALLTLMRQSLPTFPKNDPRTRVYGAFTHASMAAAFIVDTAQWDMATALTNPLPGQAGAAMAPSGSGSNPYQAFAALVRVPAIFARGLAAAMSGAPEAQKYRAELSAIRAQHPSTETVFGVPVNTVLEVQELEIAAATSAARGDLDAAITTMQQAIALEESMPPPQGPPMVIKPAHELLGEILLQARRAADAGQQFDTALYRHSNRARALLGAARAAAQQGERERAVHAYAQLLRQWQPADSQIPERQEAQEYLQKMGAQQQIGVR